MTCRCACSVARLAGAAQGVVLRNPDRNDSRSCVFKRGLNPVANESCEVLARWDQLAKSELGNVKVDVSMVESVVYFCPENCVEVAEVDDETSFLVNWAGDSNITRVGVTVKIRMRAGAKNLGVFLLCPVRSVIAVCRSEHNTSRQGNAGHRLASD